MFDEWVSEWVSEWMKSEKGKYRCILLYDKYAKMLWLMNYTDSRSNNKGRPKTRCEKLQRQA